MLKPEKRLQWKGAVVQPLTAPAQGKPIASKIPTGPRPKGLPSNAMTKTQFTIEQVQKMAAARGISVEKLLAQMVQQYLKEE